MAHAVVEGMGFTGVFLANQLEVPIHEETVAFDHFVGEIGGAIVHDHDLEEFAWILGVQDALDGTDDSVFLVVSGDDDTHCREAEGDAFLPAVPESAFHGVDI